jgi:hypothetical protein
MSKLNVKRTPVKQTPRANRVTGFSANGNLQFVKNDLQKVIEGVITSVYGVDSLYKTANARLTVLQQAMRGVVKANGVTGLEVLARVILWARHKVGLRTMPIVMGVELFKIAREFNLKFEHDRRFVYLLIRRADELTDFYAHALTVFGVKGKVPQAIKKGVGDAFNKFDAYQLAKYNREQAGTLTMRQLLRIVHAVPQDQVKSDIFAKLMNETLESPNTWEVRLSANGALPANERMSKADLWTELVMTRGSGELGYMALIRNLRNIVDAFATDSMNAMSASMFKAGLINKRDDVLKEVAARLTNPVAVAKAQVLPWTIFNAYDIGIAHDFPQVLMNALSTAADLSVSNVPSLGDNVWLIGDVSGSMTAGGVGKNTPIRLLAIMGAALFKASNGNVKLSLFSDNATFAKNMNPGDSVMTLVKSIMSQSYGGGTNLASALAQRSSLGYEPDAVVVMSDMEVNPMSAYYGGLTVPKNLSFKPNCLKIAINFNSSDTTPLDPRDGWEQLVGWSPDMFKWADLKRQGNSLIDKFINETIEVV